VQVATDVQEWQERGVRSAFARVVELEGFSSFSADELVVVNEEGACEGEILGRYGTERVSSAASGLFSSPAALSRLTVEVLGADAIAASGLSCGGRAELLLQPTSSVPAELWSALAQRIPVALLTRVEGPGAGPTGLVVYSDGTCAGHLEVAPGAELLDAAASLLHSGHRAVHRVEDQGGVVLLEVWVPPPRLIVVGDGDLVDALTHQAGLLDWELEASGDGADFGRLLDWGGASSALIMLSHDPQVDAPALAAALARRIAYVGAMGSRRTQARREERLAELGVPAGDIERIHRPIGLDLGGRRPVEIAMSICAEILATRCGRDGRPLRRRQAPINDHLGQRVPSGSSPPVTAG
jgi:xanthine dehydrogenase accessory factor